MYQRCLVDAALAGIEAADSLLDFFQPLFLRRVVRLDQPDTLASNEGQSAADAAVGDRGVDGLLGGRAIRCAGTLWQSMQSITRRSPLAIASSVAPSALSP